MKIINSYHISLKIFSIIPVAIGIFIFVQGLKDKITDDYTGLTVPYNLWIPASILFILWGLKYILSYSITSIDLNKHIITITNKWLIFASKEAYLINDFYEILVEKEKYLIIEDSDFFNVYLVGQGHKVVVIFGKEKSETLKHAHILSELLKLKLIIIS